MTQEKMEAMAVGAGSSPFNDGRLAEMHSKARELKALNRELNEMIMFKMDALLGSVPPTPETDNVEELHQDGWVEEIMREIIDGIKVCRYSLERLSVL